MSYEARNCGMKEGEWVNQAYNPYLSDVTIVEALRPNDPRSCQVDVSFQPILSSGSVVPAKDVWTHPPMVLLVMTRKIKQLAFL